MPGRKVALDLAAVFKVFPFCFPLVLPVFSESAASRDSLASFLNVGVGDSKLLSRETSFKRYYYIYYIYYSTLTHLFFHQAYQTIPFLFNQPNFEKFILGDGGATTAGAMLILGDHR